jgi:hypothetical protein
MKDLIEKILEKYNNKEYSCTVVEECIVEFVEELDRAIKDSTNNFCFIEYYDNEEIVIACGLETIYVELDYDIREIVRVNLVMRK